VRGVRGQATVTKRDGYRAETVRVTVAAPGCPYATCTSDLRQLCRPHTRKHKVDSADSESRKAILKLR